METKFRTSAIEIGACRLRRGVVVQSILSGRSILSELSEWHRYMIAMVINWLPLAGWVLYRALYYDDVSQSVSQQRELQAARYVEHTPVYDDDYRPRFR